MRSRAVGYDLIGAEDAKLHCPDFGDVRWRVREPSVHGWILNEKLGFDQEIEGLQTKKKRNLAKFHPKTRSYDLGVFDSV